MLRLRHSLVHDLPVDELHRAAAVAKLRQIVEGRTPPGRLGHAEILGEAHEALAGCGILPGNIGVFSVDSAVS